MPHPLPASARAWQEKVRRFVDEELIPFEVEAEMNNGLLPEGVRERHRRKAREIGLHALAIPKEYGGQGLTALEQAVISEQIGRVTNALGWRFSNVQRWMVKACSPYQIETWVKPLIADERHECYAITEAEADGAAVFIAGMWKTFAKAGHPGWAAIVPIYNIYILTQIAGRPGWWVLLYLIPLVNIVIMAMIAIDIAKAFGQSAVFGIVLLFLLFAAMAVGGFLLWWVRFPGYRSESLIECITNIPETELSLEQQRLREDEHERFVHSQAMLLKSPDILAKTLQVTAVRETDWYKDVLRRRREPLLELTDDLNAAPVRGTSGWRTRPQGQPRRSS